MNADGDVSTSRWRAAFTLFERLANLDEPECARELEALAQQDPEVYPHVATLIRAHRDARGGGFLATVAPGDNGATTRPSPDLESGSLLGSYRLERAIGAGGMGEVWLARRADGLFESPVALKLLHAHLATSTVRERFVREGKILGELSHSNVAHLLDAGALPDGRLFIAIEYVEGQRIDQWCDAQGLDVAARLKLFLQVCGAVSHAHAHLVVHRDLKPSNILVSADGSVKLLDFGIAKLIETTGQSLSTELTQLGGRALTPEYAAPEQVLGAAVTVATDVYSLGVLLYLLLAGRRPYGYDARTPAQVEREVLETEPAAPSRATPLKTLRKQLAGDLDTITLKALKKAPQDRYTSVMALAEDIERYLHDQPVLARPDAFSYRAKKFLRRNRLQVLAASALAFTLVAGIAGVLYQSREALHAEQRTREYAQRVKRSKDFFVGIFSSASPLHRKGETPQSLAEAVDDAIARIDSELADDPRFQGDLLSDFGEIRAGQGDFPGAKKMFDRALALHEKTLSPDDPVLANTLQNRGVIDGYYANVADGLPYMKRAVAILEMHADTEPDALANARLVLAQTLGQSGEAPAALRMVLSSLESLRRSPAPKEDNLAIALTTAGYLYHQLGQIREAAPYMREAVTVWERASGPDSPNVLTPLEVLSEAAGMDGDYAGQRAYAERQLTVARKNYPEGGPYTIAATNNLAQIHRNQGRYAEAESLFRESAAFLERSPENLGTYSVHAYGGLGRLALERDAPAEALALHERSLAICTATPVEQQPDGACLSYEHDRARTLLALNRGEEASAVIAAAVPKLRALGPRGAESLRLSLGTQADILSGLRQHEAAVVVAREHLALWLHDKPRAYAVSESRALLALCLARWGGAQHLAEAERVFSEVTEPKQVFAELLPEHRLAQAEMALLTGKRGEALKRGREAMQLLASQRPARERDYQYASALLRRIEALPPA